MTASVRASPKLRNFEKTCLMLVLLASMSSRESMRRLSSLPEGSPTRVVPPPISGTGLPPVFCSQRSIMICTSEPTWRDEAVQSKPI